MDGTSQSNRDQNILKPTAINTGSLKAVLLSFQVGLVILSTQLFKSPKQEDTSSKPRVWM